MRKTRYRVMPGQLRESTSTTLFARKDGTWAVAGGGPGGLSDGDYGDIIVSGSATVFTIDTSVVTYAKFQNVAGLSLIGRPSNSLGVASEITSTADYDVLQRSGTSLVMQPFRVENRTSDPGAPAVGQVWLRTDL